MNKIFKVEMYIDNICNTNYEYIEQIQDLLDQYSIFTTIIKCEEKDVSYITDKTDDYAWNTSDKNIRLKKLNKLFLESKSEK